MSYLVERREEEKERRREDILDAAEAVFAEKGFDAATMEQVARKARVSRALIYVYFKDKSELQVAMCGRALSILKDRFEAARASAQTGFEQIQAIGLAYIQFSMDHPTYFSAMTRMEARQVDEKLPLSALENEVGQIGQSVHLVTVKALERGIKDGSVRADIPDLFLTSLTLWAFTHGAIQLAQTKGAVMGQWGYSAATFMGGAMEMALRSLQPVPKT